MRFATTTNGGTATATPIVWRTSAIPVLARIVHVAEVFDLFTAANSYRPAVSQERALAILERAAGHQFDPKVVEAIAKVVA